MMFWDRPEYKVYEPQTFKETVTKITYDITEDAAKYHYNKGHEDGRKLAVVKELTETDLILILEVLIDSYDDTNRGFLEYEAMYKNSPMRKARIDGMKRMVDKHTHAIEMVEAILRKAQEK